MAPSTSRPLRKSEGHAKRSHDANDGASNNNLLHNANDGAATSTVEPRATRKRTRRSTDTTLDDSAHKKARLTLTLESRPKSALKRRVNEVDNVADRANTTQQPPPSLPITRATKLPRTASQLLSSNASNTHRKGSPVDDHHGNYIDKIAAGLKHELDRLQPLRSDTNITDDKRALRSQEGTRFKSELSLYFPDYDTVIGNDIEDVHALDVDTAIMIMDSNPPPSSVVSAGRIRLATSISKIPCKTYPATLYDRLYDAQHVDFSGLDEDLPPDLVDPLPPSLFDVAHKRAERVERNIRNTEKGRAQHEKDQVIRLLEGLQSHDWLKIMGVNGITEGRRKDFIPARDHFIRGCQNILDKFRSWKEEEKRRRVEKDKEKDKDRLQAEERAAFVDTTGDEDSGDDAAETQSNGDPPDYSDVDHAAARQLQQEAMLRLDPQSSMRSSISKRKSIITTYQQASEPLQPFKSFYKKPHLRDAALSTKRRSGRSATAFGQPVAEFPVVPFMLPEEMLDEETLLASARRRRRERRVANAWDGH